MPLKNKVRISRYDSNGTAIENGAWQEYDIPEQERRNYTRTTSFFIPQAGEKVQVEYFCEREKQFVQTNNGGFTTKFQVTQQPIPTVEEPEVEDPTWDLGYINFVLTDRGQENEQGAFTSFGAWRTASFNNGQWEDEFPTSQILRLEKPLTDNWGGTQILSESQVFGGVTGDEASGYGQGFDLPSQYAQNILEPFNLRVGDEIRFGYDENNTYRITYIVEPGQYVFNPPITTGNPGSFPLIQPSEASYSDAANYYYLYLDRKIPHQNFFSGSTLPQTDGSGLNLKDNFIFRRFLDDNTGVNIIYTKVNAGSPLAVQSKISPLYITQELQNNYGQILRDLDNEGVI